MIKSNLTLSEAIAQFDRSPTSSAAEGYRSQRAEILKRFPRDQWPRMPLEDYALGQPGVEDTYCYWLEYKSQWVGSIRGGSARKLIIYKRKDREGWYFPNMFSDEGEAWDRLRSEFVQAFELAGRGDWERIDELETLSLGPAVKLKSLHVHFPDEVLPVYSTAHLRRFLRLLHCPSEEVNAPSVVALNRFLLAALRRKPALEGWNTEELQRLLYNWRDPRGTKRVLKIAPGEEARFWDDCLREGYICVGWDAVGDLSQFESKEAFRARFEEAYPYNGLLAQARRKGNELWKLSELEPGDLVVANRGIGRVLAVGEVVQPLTRLPDGATLEASGDSLLELFVLLFVEASERVLRRGLLSGYVEREDDLPIVRGRILSDRQVLERFGQLDRIICRFDELEHDVVENQLLTAALQVASPLVTSVGLQRRISRLRGVLEPICDTDQLDLAGARTTVTYNRLNAHYETAHRLGWILFDALGMDDLLAPGDVRSFSFLLNMNQLFERFVTRAVEQILSAARYRVTSQISFKSVVWNVSSQRPYANIIPDVVVERRGQSDCRVAIDAKYKLYDDRGFDQGDIYQTFLYAFALGATASDGLPTSLLLAVSGDGERAWQHAASGSSVVRWGGSGNRRYWSAGCGVTQGVDG